MQLDPHRHTTQAILQGEVGGLEHESRWGGDVQGGHHHLQHGRQAGGLQRETRNVNRGLVHAIYGLQNLVDQRPGALDCGREVRVRHGDGTVR